MAVRPGDEELYHRAGGVAATLHHHQEKVAVATGSYSPHGGQRPSKGGTKVSFNIATGRLTLTPGRPRLTWAWQEVEHHPLADLMVTAEGRITNRRLVAMIAE